MLLSASLDGTIWTHEDSKPENSDKAYQGVELEQITAATWHPTKPLFAASTGTKEILSAPKRISSKDVGIFLCSNHIKLNVKELNKMHFYWINAVAWHPSLPLVACASSDETVSIWYYDGANQKLACQEMLKHDAEVNAIAWHPEKPLLISGDEQGFIKFWKINFLDVVLAKDDSLKQVALLCKEFEELAI